MDVHIIYLTQMRWKPLGRLLFSEEEESVLLNRSMEVYQLALKQLSLFIFDVIISPLILIVLISYRRKPVSELWSIDLKGEELLFHVAVIGNALIVMHDFIVMPFVILFICVFNFFRIPIVYWLLTDHFNGNNNDNNMVIIIYINTYKLRNRMKRSAPSKANYYTS